MKNKELISKTNNFLSKILQSIFVCSLFIGSDAVAQDGYEAGKIVFERKCSGCHEVGSEAVSSVGPILNNLFGRKAGTAAGYKYYSQANLNAQFIWTEDNFKKYIENPKSMIAATKQIFNGLKDKNEIDNITEYLKKFSNK